MKTFETKKYTHKAEVAFVEQRSQPNVGPSDGILYGDQTTRCLCSGGRHLSETENRTHYEKLNPRTYKLI